MSAITQCKWKINYIQTFPAQIQPKKLRKILESFFITTKRKTLHTWRTDVFELPDNKSIGKLFLKYQLFSVLIHLKYWYYNNASLQLPCLPRHLCRISPWPTETSLRRNHHRIFSYLIRPHTTIIGYNKP